MEESKRENKQESAQELLELGASTTKSSKGNIYTLTIIGQIEGHQTLPETVKTTKYEHVIPLLAAVEESEDIDGLLLLLNTVGGDIEAGLAIAELIAGMKKPTVLYWEAATRSGFRWPFLPNARSSRREPA